MVRVEGAQRTRHPTPVMPFVFLPNLTRVKFGSACPPLVRRDRARQPGQALPNFQPSGSPQPPLVSGLRLQPIGPIDLPLAGRSDGPLATGFRGRGGRSGATGSHTTPNACYVLRLLAGFDTCQIRQRLPALGQVLQGAPARAGAAEFPGRLDRPNRPCPSLRSEEHTSELQSL